MSTFVEQELDRGGWLYAAGCGACGWGGGWSAFKGYAQEQADRHEAKCKGGAA